MLNTKQVAIPNRLNYDDEKRYDYMRQWREKPLLEKYDYIQSCLKQHGVEFTKIKNPLNKTEQLTFMKEELHGDEDDVYSDFETASFDRLLEILLYDKIICIETDVFIGNEDIDDVLDIYPNIWIYILRYADIKLKLSDFTVTVNGKAPIMDDPFENDTIDIAFTYNDKPFKYTYFRHSYLNESIDFSVIQDIETFLHKIHIDLHFLSLFNDFGGIRFLLPCAVVEAFDKYIAIE